MASVTLKTPLAFGSIALESRRWMAASLGAGPLLLAAAGMQLCFGAGCFGVGAEERLVRLALGKICKAVCGALFAAAMLGAAMADMGLGFAACAATSWLWVVESSCGGFVAFGALGVGRILCVGGGLSNSRRGCASWLH